MKLDGVINNVYFKQSIRGNTDNITEDDMAKFIDCIKQETDLGMQDKIYIHSLYSSINNCFECENSSIIDKFKIILADKTSMKIAVFNENHKCQIETLSFDGIENMELMEVDDEENPYYEAYRLTMNMKDKSQLVLDTSTSVSQIRKDMDRFLNNLKVNFDNFNK